MIFLLIRCIFLAWEEPAVLLDFLLEEKQQSLWGRWGRSLPQHFD